MTKWLAAFAGLFLWAGAASAQDIMKPITTYNIPVTSSSVAITSPVGANIFAVRLWSDVTAHVMVGISPQTADTTGLPLAAGEAQTFAIRSGETIAVIRADSDGTLYITELSK